MQRVTNWQAANTQFFRELSLNETTTRSAHSVDDFIADSLGYPQRLWFEFRISQQSVPPHLLVLI